MSRFRSTFLLVLVFAVLFSYFWIYQKDKKAPDPATSSTEQTPESVQLASYKLDDLTEVSWKSASYSATLQNPGEQKWKLVQPALPSDVAKSATYVDSLNNLVGTRKYKAKDLSPADTQFDKPTLTIIFKKKDNSTNTVKIGAKTVDGDYYYAMKDGSDSVTLLSSFVVEDANKDPNTLKPDPSASPTASTSSAPVSVPNGSTSPQS